MRTVPTTFFIIFGYGIKDKAKKFAEWSILVRVIMLIMLLAVQVVMCYFKNEIIDVHVFRLGTQWLYFPKAIVGSLAVLMLSQMIHFKCLIVIGRKTKELMILHHQPFYWTLVLSFVLGKVFQPNIIGGLIITVAPIVGCLVIDWIMCRFKIWNYVMGK